MDNVTKILINKPAREAFEAFVDPAKIGNFWFSSSSQRWEAGRTITLRYDEYNAEGDIELLEMEPNRKIVFRWGTDGSGNVVTIQLHESDGATIVEVREEGFRADDDSLLPMLLDNKEGWVFTLTCLKAYLDFGVTQLRGALVKG